MLQHSLVFDKDIIIDKKSGKQMLNLCQRTFVIPKDFTYSVIEVTEEYVGRMDLVSKMLYDDDQYTDLLCKVNGISNPFELNVGNIIIAPNITDLYKFYQKEEEDSESNKMVDDEEIDKDKDASKKTKRSANGDIMSNPNFVIDKNKRVIIY